MGLDMDLIGQKFYPLWLTERKEDGFDVEVVSLRLGYWRKHPDLHGYIVETFSNGIDDKNDIPLNKDDLRNIISAIGERRLPKTTGFAFGESKDTDSQRATDIEIFERALKWLEEADMDSSAPKSQIVWRSVIYRACW